MHLGFGWGWQNEFSEVLQQLRDDRQHDVAQLRPEHQARHDIERRDDEKTPQKYGFTGLEISLEGGQVQEGHRVTAGDDGRSDHHRQKREIPQQPSPRQSWPGKTLDQRDEPVPRPRRNLLDSSLDMDQRTAAPTSDGIAVHRVAARGTLRRWCGTRRRRRSQLSRHHVRPRPLSRGDGPRGYRHNAG